MFLNEGQGCIPLNSVDYVELDHQNIIFGDNSTELAWRVSSNSCNKSRILSYPQCQPHNTSLNETLSEERLIIPSRLFQDGKADFNISSLSDKLTQQCPSLPETVRFMGNLDC